MSDVKRMISVQGLAHMKHGSWWPNPLPLLPLVLVLSLLPLACGRWSHPTSVKAGAPQASHPCPLDADLWVLAGQSNMEGAGLLKETIKPNPKIVCFDLDNHWMTAELPTHRTYQAAAPVFKNIRLQGGMTPQLWEEKVRYNKIKPEGGAGPDLFFAQHILKNTGRPIGLIPCALGGTCMKLWDPATKDQHGNSLYGNMIDRIRMTGGHIKGVLWYQGEADAVAWAAKDYAQTFTRFVDCLRRDTGIPDLPVLFVQIGRFTVYDYHELGPWWEVVREQQRLALSMRPHIYMVTGIDLPLDDGIHLSLDSQRRLGRRMAEVALTEIYHRRGHAKPINLESVKVTDPHGMPKIHLRFSGVNGCLRAAGRINGFDLRYATKPQSSEITCIYRADFDPNDPSSIILSCFFPLKEPVSLIYGPGLDPYLNILDEKDIPVPAFGPIEISEKNYQ